MAYEYYKLCKLNLKIKHYIERIPKVSKNIKNLLHEFTQGRYSEHAHLNVDRVKPAKTQILDSLRHTVMSLMLDEFEIVCWVVYMEQFNLLNLTFDVNRTHAVLQDALLNIFYIGLSTKLLLNDSTEVKNRISAHLRNADHLFLTRYHHWSFVHGSYFEHKHTNSLLQTNKILKKLNKGFEVAEFNIKQHTLDWQKDLQKRRQAEAELSKMKSSDSGKWLSERLNDPMSSYNS